MSGTNDDLHEPRGFVPEEKMGIGSQSRTEYVCCGEGEPGGYSCTQPRGHDGDHIATLRSAVYDAKVDHLCARWPQKNVRADDDFTVTTTSTEHTDLLAPDFMSLGGAPTRASILPTDAAGRKQYPIASGFFDYFPDAICAVANLSWHGNNQHNPGQPLHWDRSKSTDEPDTMLRHFVQRGTLDSDGIRHSAKMAWRALAILQKEIEAETR